MLTIKELEIIKAALQSDVGSQREYLHEMETGDTAFVEFLSYYIESESLLQRISQELSSQLAKFERLNTIEKYLSDLGEKVEAMIAVQDKEDTPVVEVEAEGETTDFINDAWADFIKEKMQGIPLEYLQVNEEVVKVVNEEVAVVKELSENNKKRAKGIRLAEEYLEDTIGDTVNNVKFIVNEEKRNVKCVVEGFWTGDKLSSSSVVCLKEDTFNITIGKAIALAKALKHTQTYKFFSEMPQPDDFAVGQVLEWTSYINDFYKITNINKNGTLDFYNSTRNRGYKECDYSNSILTEHFTARVADDSEAIYN